MSETKYNFESLAKDLKPGDKVRLPFCNGPFSDAMVKQVSEGLVHFFRPFCPSAYTVYSGNTVLCYIGVEEFSVLQDSTLYHVYERTVFE